MLEEQTDKTVMGGKWNKPSNAEEVLSKAVQRLRPSATNSTAQRARELRATGHDVIALSTGEPDFKTPDHIRSAAIKAIETGYARYTPVGGIPELRSAIQAKFKHENNLDYDLSEIMVSTGGKQVIANAMLATIDPGDEVIIPAPFWVSYPELVTFCGGNPIVVQASAADGFLMSAASLEAAISPKTKWLIINSPCNPSGAVYDAMELAALAEVLRKYPQVYILSDDIYEHLIYTGVPFRTLAEVAPDLKSRILTMNGVSKAYAMTGWRIGYAGGPALLIRAMEKIQGQTTSSPNAIAQQAAVAALNGPQDFLVERCESFRRRRDLVVKKLNAVDGLHCELPDGAFYAYPSCASIFGKRSPAGAIIDSDLTFCTALLNEAGVAVVHGSAFGLPGHFRVSYAASEGKLSESCDRIAGFCASLQECFQ